MKRSVFMLQLVNGEFQIVPFRHSPDENILTPSGWRKRKGRKKKK